MSADARLAEGILARFGLGGRTAVVVGTSENIGAGIAIGLAEAGAAVACLDRRAENAADAAATIARAGGRATGAACDVTKEPDVDAAIARILEQHGPIDILVNGATLYNEKGVLEMPLAEWKEQLDTILTGAFLVTWRVATAMVAAGRGGSIVNIASTAAHQGEPHNIGYSTAKAGLLNFTRSAAMELAGHRIRVNSLTPTSTSPEEAFSRQIAWERPVLPPAEQATTREFFARLAGRVPLRQLPLPSDYAAAVVYLASDAARLVTGTDLRVDAGTVAKYWRWEIGEDHRPPKAANPLDEGGS